MWQCNSHLCLWVLIMASVTSCWRRSPRHVYVRCTFYGFVCVALFCEVLSLVINTFAFGYLLWRPWRHADAIAYATFTSSMSFVDTSASWCSVITWSHLIRILAFGYLLLLLCRHTDAGFYVIFVLNISSTDTSAVFIWGAVILLESPYLNVLVLATIYYWSVAYTLS